MSGYAVAHGIRESFSDARTAPAKLGDRERRQAHHLIARFASRGRLAWA